ncbi:MAG: FAD-binding oxidoreductase, partial [Candidatus Hermodarchaeota archaeon]
MSNIRLVTFPNLAIDIWLWKRRNVRGQRNSTVEYMPTNQIKAEAITPTKLNTIRTVEGEKTIAEDCSDYLTDEARFGDGRAERLFYARTEPDVVAIIKWANETKTPLTISAGRTGLTGGAVPQGGALLTLELMTNLLGMGFDQPQKRWYLRAEPGVTLETLNSAVLKKQL